MPSRPIPPAALALVLAGCLDFSFKPAVDAERNDVVPGGDGDETPSCPTRAEACADRCGLVELDGCTPYACEPCCMPTVSCESIVAQCGSLDTGCGTVECPNRCDEGVSCLENRCCIAEPEAVTCRGRCGGSAVNDCGDEVSCANPCGQHSAGCRDAAPPAAATCFCPHAYQGETCEERQLPLVHPVDVALEPGSGRAYVLDRGARAVLVVDPETGARFTLSDGDDDGVARGTGPAFSSPRRIALDLPNRRAFVTDMELHAVLQVDLEHGHRTYVSGQGHGSGPELSYPKGLALDVPNDVAYVIDDDALFEIRLSTGVRRIVSTAAEGAAIGAGPPLRVPMDLAVDLAGERAYVVGAEVVLAVDLASGDRSLISTASTFTTPEGTLRGSGPKFSAVISGAFDLANRRAFVGDTVLDAIVAVDLDSGDRSYFSAEADPEGMPHGAGPAFEQPFGLRVDASGTALWVADSLLGAIARVDIATGDRSWPVDGGVGAGPRLQEPISVALDARRSRALVVDTYVWDIVEIDLASGKRSMLAGSGPALERPLDIAVDLAGSYAYVADRFVGIVRIDLQSGVRRVVSDADDASLGPALGSLLRIALDEPRQQLLVAGSTKLFAVDLATGERTILADGTHGSGPLFRIATDVTFDAANHVALVLNGPDRALYAVDVVDGTRTVVSGQSPEGTVRGQGEAFDRPVDVVFDANSGRAYVGDDDTHSVLAVDLASGDRTPISTMEGGRTRRGTGIGLVSPEGLAAAGGGRLLVIDPTLCALVSVDVATGDRTLVSRVTF